MKCRLLTAALVSAAVVSVAAQEKYVPVRVYDSARTAYSDFEGMLAAIAGADVVFVGEQHDDPNTHRLELMLLQGLARRRSNLVVSLEMFERDVQAPLNEFAAGRMTEPDFLMVARPWPAYATDYKPLVDFAIAQHWPVVAANVPRPIASEVSKSGLDALTSKSAAERTQFAADLKCPMDDDYFRRFTEAMGGHSASPAGGGDSVAAARQTLERFYLSQCLKDETMAEAVARAWQQAAAANPQPLVVHYNGAFHSDFGEGTAERTKRRLDGRRVVVISILPVKDLDALAPADDRKRADFLVYTVGKV